MPGSQTDELYVLPSLIGCTGLLADSGILGTRAVSRRKRARTRRPPRRRDVQELRLRRQLLAPPPPLRTGGWRWQGAGAFSQAYLRMGVDPRGAAQSARPRWGSGTGQPPLERGERLRRRLVTASTMWDVTVWTAGAPTGQRARVGHRYGRPQTGGRSAWLVSTRAGGRSAGPASMNDGAAGARRRRHCETRRCERRARRRASGHEPGTVSGDRGPAVVLPDRSAPGAGGRSAGPDSTRVGGSDAGPEDTSRISGRGQFAGSLGAGYSQSGAPVGAGTARHPGRG